MMEPVAWQWEEYFTEWGTGTNGEYKHSTMWDDEKPADHPDIRDVTPLVRLSDAEARIAELQSQVDNHANWTASMQHGLDRGKELLAAAEARAEAAEALLKEAAESDNSLLGKLKVMRGVYAMQGEQYTSRALHNIITEFEATRAAHDKIGGK